MSGVTKRQARILRKQIRRIYGRNYIPNLTVDNNISIGDILLDDNDVTPVIDGSEFPASLVKYNEGPLVDRNITSSSEVTMSTKLKGKAILPEYFKVNEAGIAVSFSGNNQMFLKIQGGRQRSMSNFIKFRKHILEKYTKGEISSKIYIVRGVIYADKYFLQYSGKKGGTLGFDLDGKATGVDVDLKANFSLKWKNEVGYSVDARNGGVLGYRVSAVRLKRHRVSNNFQLKMLNGVKEADVLNNISFSAREKLLTSESIELVDVTDSLILSKETIDANYE